MDLNRRYRRAPRHALAGRVLVAIVLTCGWLPAAANAVGLAVSPERVTLDGRFERCQLLVRAAAPAECGPEWADDLTHAASYHSADPTVATVSPAGVVSAVGNGATEIRVVAAGSQASIGVVVSGVVDPPRADFDRDILPVITRAGCNAGACHASQYGKGGFVLSVMAFDPQLDFSAIALASRGRRVCQTNPAGSLLLAKATNRIPHGGGPRLIEDSADYRLLATWIAAGTPGPSPSPVEVTRVTVEPAKRVAAPGATQQIRVVADYADGSQRDVTAWTRFDCLDEGVVTVTPDGRATTVGKGQGAVMARFGGEATITTFVVPFADGAANLAGWTSPHPLDVVAARKFAEIGLTPAGICDDATFLRRAFLDSVGGLPTVEEARAFHASTAPDKRERLVDELLGLSGDPARDRHVDRYAAWWSLKWADLIRNNSAVLGESGMWALHNWLRESFRTNMPMDRFVTELVTAKGSIFSSGPANYFRIANSPTDLAESTAQLFLGTRLQCAKCHHHPYERLSQADYYGFAAFFARVASKSSAEFGIFGGETIVVVNQSGEVSHPRTGAVMKPTPLEGEGVEGGDDRRIALATWLTAPDNAWFSRNIVNRYVAYLLGRGLVEPIDDIRSTNPPSNPEMMDLLVAEFRAGGFDVRRLMRFIMTSRLYQLDSQPDAANAADERFYSHYRVKRLGAEALLDSIDDATGVRTKFPNLPLGTRAIELPDAAAATTNPFLVTFGKPKRASVCECERTPDENLAQALHTLNGDIVATKVADGAGRVAKLLAAGTPVPGCVEEIYLASLSRPPTPAEAADAAEIIAASPSPAEGLQDLLWGLINSKHFLFVR
jgi:hypothetical protein